MDTARPDPNSHGNALDQGALRALFERTATPMLLVDDRRRYRDANRAAARMLGLEREQILDRRIDDFTPPEARGGLEAQWGEFLAKGEQDGRFALLRPDGSRVEVDYSATAHILDGFHLAIFSTQASEREWFEGPVAASTEQRLSEREREVLTLLALGESGAEIAGRLFIAPDTVRRHVANARAKLGARSRSHAVMVAVRRGEIEP